MSATGKGLEALGRMAGKNAKKFIKPTAEAVESVRKSGFSEVLKALGKGNQSMNPLAKALDDGVDPTPLVRQAVRSNSMGGKPLSSQQRRELAYMDTALTRMVDDLEYIPERKLIKSKTQAKARSMLKKRGEHPEWRNLDLKDERNRRLADVQYRNMRFSSTLPELQLSKVLGRSWPDNFEQPAVQELRKSVTGLHGRPVDVKTAERAARQVRNIDDSQVELVKVLASYAPDDGGQMLLPREISDLVEKAPGLNRQALDFIRLNLQNWGGSLDDLIEMAVLTGF
jgi:hypothetical protein